MPFAGDLSLLFPVDVRNATVYVKAAAAVDDSNLALAEELLGAAGLWACAAEMHRIHGNKEDFARIARSHVPHLLKSLASKSEQQQQQRIASHGDTGLRERPKDTPADISAASSVPSRPSFPAPPSPLRSGIRRARYFIPGYFCAFVCMSWCPRVSLVSAACAAVCTGFWVALLGFAVKLPCVDCNKAKSPSPLDSVTWGVPVTLALNLWVRRVLIHPAASVFAVARPSSSHLV